jgi:hypothetical protein
MSINEYITLLTLDIHVIYVYIKSPTLYSAISLSVLFRFSSVNHIMKSGQAHRI